MAKSVKSVKSVEKRSCDKALHPFFQTLNTPHRGLAGIGHKPKSPIDIILGCKLV